MARSTASVTRRNFTGNVDATVTISSTQSSAGACAEIDGGLNNACGQGIIAYCPTPEDVKFRVCTAGDDEEAATKICEEPWQVPGRYRCAQEDPECFGCRPP